MRNLPPHRSNLGRKSNGCSVYIKNLSRYISENVLVDFMAQVGFVVNVTLNKNVEGFPVGDAVVEYERPLEAEKAMSMLNGALLMGNSVYMQLDDGRFNDRGFACYKCGESGHMARNCNAPEVCYKCGGTGHIAKECASKDLPETRVCFYCKKPGHLAADCKSEKGDGCYNCGGRGHISRTCPENKEDSIGKKCFVCKKTGHLIKDCPERGEGHQRECYKCGSFGHIAKDCDLPDDRICYSCGRPGHVNRDCPLSNQREGPMAQFDQRERSMPQFDQREGPIPQFNQREGPFPPFNQREGPIPPFNQREGPIPPFNQREGPISPFNQREGPIRCHDGMDCDNLLIGQCEYFHPEFEVNAARNLRIQLLEERKRQRQMMRGGLPSAGYQDARSMGMPGPQQPMMGRAQAPLRADTQMGMDSPPLAVGTLVGPRTGIAISADRLGLELQSIGRGQAAPPQSFGGGQGGAAAFVGGKRPMGMMNGDMKRGRYLM